jgi:CRP-like cAMP-binding protein
MAPQPCQDLPQSKKASDDYEFQKSDSLVVHPRSVTLRFIRGTAASHRPPIPERCLLFSNISRRDCEEIVGAARELRFQRGQTIHIEGDPVRRVVLLTSGSAKVMQFGQDGTEVILRLCGPGELVGTLVLSPQGLHCSTSQALRVSSALIWEIGVFEQLARRFSVLRFNAALILGKQLEDLEDRFREISTERVEVRLSRQVMRLMDQVGLPLSGGVEISISREELAQLIGTTMYTVSRLLSNWDRRGIVKARREAVLVSNPRALEVLSNGVD